MSLVLMVLTGVKMIVSSSAQVPPRPAGASHRLTAAPPVTRIFFSLPPAKNAIHCPSGEKNGLAAPSVLVKRCRLKLIELADEEPRLSRLPADKCQRCPVRRQNRRRAQVCRQRRVGADARQQLARRRARAPHARATTSRAKRSARRRRCRRRPTAAHVARPARALRPPVATRTRRLVRQVNRLPPIRGARRQSHSTGAWDPFRGSAAACDAPARADRRAAPASAHRL